MAAAPARSSRKQHTVRAAQTVVTDEQEEPQLAQPASNSRPSSPPAADQWACCATWQIVLRCGKRPLGRLLNPVWTASSAQGLHLHFSLWQPWCKPSWQVAQSVESLWKAVQQHEQQQAGLVGQISLSLVGRSAAGPHFVLPLLQLDCIQVQAGVHQHFQQRAYIEAQQARFLALQVVPAFATGQPAQKEFQVSQGPWFSRCTLSFTSTEPPQLHSIQLALALAACAVDGSGDSQSTTQQQTGAHPSTATESPSMATSLVSLLQGSSSSIGRAQQQQHQHEEGQTGVRRSSMAGSPTFEAERQRQHFDGGVLEPPTVRVNNGPSQQKPEHTDDLQSGGRQEAQLPESTAHDWHHAQAQATASEQRSKPVAWQNGKRGPLEVQAKNGYYTDQRPASTAWAPLPASLIAGATAQHTQRSSSPGHIRPLSAMSLGSDSTQSHGMQPGTATSTGRPLNNSRGWEQHGLGRHGLEPASHLGSQSSSQPALQQGSNLVGGQLGLAAGAGGQASKGSRGGNSSKPDRANNSLQGAGVAQQGGSMRSGSSRPLASFNNLTSAAGGSKPYSRGGYNGGRNNSISRASMDDMYTGPPPRPLSRGPQQQESQAPVLIQELLTSLESGCLTDWERLREQITPMMSLTEPGRTLESLRLQDVWCWYHEPSLYGREVVTLGGARGPSHSYFTPFLSAIQLFTGASSKMGPGTGRQFLCDTDGWEREMQLQFEHFENELPFNRHPLHEHIEILSQQHEASRTACAASKAAADASNVSLQEQGSEAVQAGPAAPSEHSGVSPQQPGQTAQLHQGQGQAQQHSTGEAEEAAPWPLLQALPLTELHEASWYCVAWYPVYRVPDAPLVTRFLTFHSFAPLVASIKRLQAEQHCADGPAPPLPPALPMHVVGLQFYNMHGERWFDPLTSMPSGQVRHVVDDVLAGEVKRTVGAQQGKLARQQLMYARHAEDMFRARISELQATAERLARGKGLRVVGSDGQFQEPSQRHSDFEFFHVRCPPL